MSAPQADFPIQIDVGRLAEMRTADPALQVLDVREGWETDICKIAGAQLIPMGQVPARVAEIDPERPLVVVCHHGGRSMQVTMWLRGQGYDKAMNLSGGIDAWAREIDPKMATY